MKRGRESSPSESEGLPKAGRPEAREYQSFQPNVFRPDYERQPNQGNFMNALDFLEQVKQQFSDRPEVYNEFLEIMKDFKTHVIDTPGVIARVSQLFRGYEHLMEGFNNFLPPNFRIEADKSLRSSGNSTGSPAQTRVNPAGAVTQVPPGQSHKQQKQTQQVQQPQQQPELENARSYVKKIKTRFRDQPEIYKSFLRILHSYRQEAHSIRSVYQQVADLFGDHPDLLMEFVQFLPDTQSNSLPPNYPRSGNKQKPGKAVKNRPIQQQQQQQQQLQQQQQAQQNRLKRKEEKKKRRFEEEPQDEFFANFKLRLRNKGTWEEIVKVLNLYNFDVLKRHQVMALMRDLLDDRMDLYEDFKQRTGFEDAGFPDLNQHMAWNEIDFRQCKRYGPSYRGYPPDYKQPICSGRTPEHQLVLNDYWVSVPTGSEDGGSFKTSTKNQYEELLFKCEDDRYELDMVIELNNSTIKVLEPILQELMALSKTEQANYKLKDHVDVLHLRSIERIYADKGTEMIDGLMSNPVVAVPLILRRLRQKDQEWRKAQKEWNKIWREVNEKNYHKSLDHQSFYFKQVEKKNLSSKILVAEIKQKVQERAKEEAEANEPHLVLTIRDRSIVDDVLLLIRRQIDHQYSDSDKEKIEAFVSNFLCRLYGGILPPSEAESEEDKTVDTKDKEQNAAETTPTGATEATGAVAVAPADTSSANGNVTTNSDGASAIPKKKNSATSFSSPILFYGNTAFYVLIRHFQILCDRLVQVKEVSAAQLRDRNKSSVQSLMTVTGNGVDPSNNANANANAGSENHQPTPPAQPASPSRMMLSPSAIQAKINRPLLGQPVRRKFTSAEEMYNYFINDLLKTLQSGQMDQNKYEDQVRETFGIAGYVLYTLDKVLSHLLKQIELILSEENSNKLMALFNYEASRTNGFMDTIYNSHARDLLGEEKCFKIECNHIPGDPSRIETAITLLDSTRQPAFLELNFEKEKWNNYVEGLVGKGDNKFENNIMQKVLLRRNKKLTEDRSLDNIVVDNRLECKICLSTYRLFYVEDTEDYYYRQGALTEARKHVNPIKRSKNWRTWLHQPGKEQTPLVEETAGKPSSFVTLLLSSAPPPTAEAAVAKA